MTNAIVPGSKPPAGLTPKVRAAIDALVYCGLDLDEAAKEVGLTTRALRLATEKAPVLAYLRKQRRVLLASMTGKNLAALARARDQLENPMATVRAVQAIEGMS